MAELGTIQQINENAGTRPTDTRALERAVSTGLSTGAAIHTAEVLDEAGEQVTDVLAEAVADANAVEVRETVDRTGDAEVDILRQEVMDLHGDVANGDQALRIRAELGIQEKLTRMRGLNPALAAQISSQVSGVVAASPALDALGLADSVLDAQSTAATKELDRLYKNATTKVSAGGLGMPFTIDFSNPDDVRAYLDADKRRATMEAADLLIGSTLASTASTAQQNLMASGAAFVGFQSRISATMREQMTDLRAYTTEVAKPVGEQNAQLIDSMKETTQAMIVNNLDLMEEITNFHQEMWANPLDRASGFFKVAEEQFQDKKKLIEDWNAGLAERKDQSYYDIQLAALQTEAMQSSHTNAPYRDMLRLVTVDPRGTIYKMISDSMTGADVVFKDDISRVARAALGGIFSPQNTPDALAQLHYNSGQGKVTPDMTPMAIERSLRNNLRFGDSPFGTGSSTETEDLEAGMAQLAQVQVYLRQMVREEADSAPTAAKVLLNGTSALILYNDIGNPAANQLDDVITMLAHESTLAGIRTTGDGQFKNVRTAFGDAAQEFLGSDNLPFAKERTAQQAAWSTPRLGGQLKDFAQVNFYKDDSEFLEVDVNTAAVAEATYQMRVPDPDFDQAMTKQTWIKRNQSTIDRNVRLVQQDVQNIVNFANNDVRASAHMQFAYSNSVTGANDPSYRWHAQNTGWLDALAP